MTKQQFREKLYKQYFAKGKKPTWKNVSRFIERNMERIIDDEADYATAETVIVFSQELMDVWYSQKNRWVRFVANILNKNLAEVIKTILEDRITAHKVMRSL